MHGLPTPAYHLGEGYNEHVLHLRKLEEYNLLLLNFTNRIINYIPITVPKKLQ
jgi:hypothetical protein